MKARKARKKKEGAQEAKANKHVSREGTWGTKASETRNLAHSKFTREHPY